MVWKIKLTVEVPLVLSFISFQLVEAVLLNLLIYRTCYVTLEHNKTECGYLGNSNNETLTGNLTKEVQPYANVVMMVRSLTEQSFNVLLCLVLGPWSDRFGRKPVIIMSQLGMAIGMSLLSINSCFDTSPWFFMISDIPSMLTGGGTTYFTVLLAYISDISTEETRGMRMAIYEASTAIGTVIGNAISSYIFHATGYTTVFALAASFTIIGILYTIFFIPESLNKIDNKVSSTQIAAFSNFRPMYQVLAKKRDGFKRAIILISIFVLVLINFVGSGEFGVVYLYLMKRLNWTVTKYTLYLSINTIISVIGTMTSIYFFHKRIEMRESVLALIGLAFTIFCVLLQGLATSDIYIYFGAFLKGVLGGVTVPMIRTLVSKLVSADEGGKVFSTIMTSAYLIGLGGGPLYSLIYNNTLSQNPGVFYYMSAGLHMTSAILILIIIKLEAKQFTSYSDELAQEAIEKEAHVD